ncbi:MAG: glycoside hydrolase family 88 protein [Ruminococcus sp.]|uniref:glycoside hydrolase family 88/105 protein n=1 Tax=Ruminococcus sp. TaxID=41978 RepID=UPI0025CD4A9C|nr:glycoside hydrolase family 88 protein [Ruminococcus sp.]MCR4796117.1 glycoside hydrolase family 88 protein [Ruminococcus sp.]
MTRQQSIVNDYIEKLILSSDPLDPLWNVESMVCGKAPKWNYIDNCMITAVLMLYETESDERLLDYSVKYMDTYVNDDGTIPTMNCADYNLDNLCGGRNLISLWKHTNSEHYRLGFEKLWKEQVLRQPRLSCGNFWHKAIYPDQIWLDGTYMAMPFMAEYGKLHDLRGVMDDVERQLFDMRKITRDPKTGLFYHGYDDTKNMIWADPITGLSPEFWLRSNGWICAAMADVFEILEDQRIGKMLAEILGDIIKYCRDDGMLYQLPAKPELEGNYPETSGTLLVAYSAMKAARLGICGEDIRQAGLKAFKTVTDKFINTNAEIPVLGNICLVGGLGGENERDGSAGYYLSEKITQNDAKGIAPYIMAFTETKKM